MTNLKCFQLNPPTSSSEVERKLSEKVILLVQEAINQSPHRDQIIQDIEALERRGSVPDVELYVEEE